MTQLIRFLGIQNPSWSVRKKVPSGLRQTPLGARKPVARISVGPPSLPILQQRAVLRHDGRQAVPRRLGVIEVPLGVDLEAHGELVEVLGDLVVAVEALVEVGLAVAVEVAEADDLVAAADVDLPVDDLQPQRLEQPRGDPPPGQPARRVVEPVDDPDVAVPGADRGAPAVGEEVEARGPHLAEPGIAVGERQDIDGERPVVAADDRLRLEDLGPSPRAAAGEASRATPARATPARRPSSASGSPPDISTLRTRDDPDGGDAQHDRPVATRRAGPGTIAGEGRRPLSRRGHSHRQLDGRGADLQRPGEDRDAGLGGVGLEAGHLEDIGRADGVGEDHAVAVAVEAPVARPGRAAAGRSGRPSRPTMRRSSAPGRPGRPSRGRRGWRRGPGRRPGDGPGAGR